MKKQASLAILSLFLASPLAAATQTFDTSFYPILAVSAEELGALIAKGNRERDGKRLVTTAHLAFDAQHKGFLGIKMDVNSANTRINAEKDLKTGEIKMVMDVEFTYMGNPMPMTMLMFDGDKSVNIPLKEISRFERIISGTWQKSCNKFTGCQNIRTADRPEQSYRWQVQLPVDAVRNFAASGNEPAGRLAFWLGHRTEKAAKQAPKIIGPNLLLFRNQAKAIFKALEIPPAR